MEVLQGHERSSTYGFARAQPRALGADADVTARAYQQVSCSKRLSSFDETARGVSVTAVGGGPARLEYQLVFREIADPTRLASKAIRHQLGHSAQELAGVLVRRGHARRATRPTAGALYRFRASSPASARTLQMTRFFKQEVEAQVARSPADGVTPARRAPSWARSCRRRRRAQKGHLRGGPLLPGRRRVCAASTRTASAPDERRLPKDAEAAKAAGVLSRDAVGGDIVGSLLSPRSSSRGGGSCAKSRARTRLRERGDSGAVPPWARRAAPAARRRT